MARKLIKVQRLYSKKRKHRKFLRYIIHIAMNTGDITSNMIEKAYKGSC